jgi:hypothetical protein
LEIGPHRVVARFWPIIQPRRPSPLPDPPISISSKNAYFGVFFFYSFSSSAIISRG